MAPREWIPIRVLDGVLDTRIRGSGDPVILIQTALTRDEFLPVSVQADLADKYEVLLYHRRGYGGSSPARGAGSIERDAVDCRHLLRTLGIGKAHVVGVSYSAAVALQLAASAPGAVQSLCLIEPPPVHTPAATEFVAACGLLIEDYRRRGPARAIDGFLTRLMGPAWRTDLEQHGAGHATDVERDAETFFTADIPALLGWRFGTEEARRVTQPVLYVGGSNSGPWFAEVRQLLLRWLPHAENVVLAGADHSLAITHAAPLAAALADFLSRHPLGLDSPPNRDITPR
ncbi:alpha/beta fold hydrolase [Arthrobacter sp. CAN_A6]|uniref:alpha/beta fold hydrolase n=1 Tax=Arthrobacter sp. CAN_A6 TaxID=2787721 RepID=UPI002FF0DEAE